jgi:hypothetical protein
MIGIMQTPTRSKKDLAGVGIFIEELRLSVKNTLNSNK